MRFPIFKIEKGRLDGAVCEYSEEDKMAYLTQVSQKVGISNETLIPHQGATNMEMEALVFAALTHKAGIRSAVVCVTLLDRLQGDQVTIISLIEAGCEGMPGDDTKGGAYPVAGQAHGSSFQVLNAQ